MATPNAQFLGQIVFNLLLMIVLAVLLVRVVGDLVTGTGNLGENLFLLVVVGVGLFIGGGFLLRLIHAAQGKK
ncbi:MAG: high-affinity Fe2+/Pb2+ permease [Candidatus Latescibacterota bacterium]|jgi:high-affinity Fe2+/Pb2+ permease